MTSVIACVIAPCGLMSLITYRYGLGGVITPLTIVSLYDCPLIASDYLMIASLIRCSAR
jgi:hypothetical protein